MLKVCLISKCCSSWLSFSKDYFMQNAVSYHLTSSFVQHYFLHLILEEMEVKGKFRGREICLVYAYFLRT